MKSLRFLTLWTCASLFALPAAALQTPTITIDDVVRIKYISAPTWSPDGTKLAYIWDDEGQIDLWVVDADSGETLQITRSGSNPGFVSWSPNGRSVRYLEEGDLFEADANTGQGRAIIKSEARESGVQFAPDDSGLLFNRDGTLWYRSFTDSVEMQLSTENRRVSGPSFSPDGKRLLFTAGAGGGRGAGRRGGGRGGAARGARGGRGFGRGGGTRGEIQIMDLTTGQIVWKSPRQDLQSPEWLPDGRRIFCRQGGRGSTVFSVVDTRTDEIVEVSEPLSGRVQPTLAPSGDAFMFMRDEDGEWDHLWTVSFADKKAKQITSGAYELSMARWSPDGKSIIYSSNEGESGQRHLYIVPANGGSRRRITDHLPGTNIEPRFSPDGSKLAFIHCGPFRASDIWTMKPAPESPARQLTSSMPSVWTRENITVPEEVTYKGALDWDINAWLFKPKGFDPEKKYPAIVWLHGGPIRQMRYGWHPRRGYSLFYSYHQRLLQMGYVVLSVNYRGGIGFGKEFTNALQDKMGIDDVVDVINGGQHLKTLPYVDPERVGVWGLSYGGYMTLQALGKHAGVFSMGINIAGVYNWTTQVEIYNFSGRFVNFMGGPPQENPEPYRVGSPITYVQNIKVPLLNLQGTADRNVPFSQMDEIVESMVKYNLDFEVMYYPGQVHVFQDGDVWRNAFPRIEKFFEEHLKNGGK